MNWSPRTIELIEAAFAEDVGGGDITAGLLAAHGTLTARMVPRTRGVICGLALAPAIGEVFARRLGAALAIAPLPNGDTRRPFADGDLVPAGTAVAEISGPTAAVLATERTLLNFLCRLSGVATLTRQYVDAARAVCPEVAILDTRKTIPGWRELDKYAVRAGGGHNHRAGLYDAVLIKDNHLAGIPIDRLAEELLVLLGRLSAQPRFVEVEVDSLPQLEQVCRVPGVDIVLLDNFAPAQMRAAVGLRDGLGLRRPMRGEPTSPVQRSLLLEASGGVALDTVADIAATGVDRISVGALTHSAPALDIGLDA